MIRIPSDLFTLAILPTVDKPFTISHSIYNDETPYKKAYPIAGICDQRTVLLSSIVIQPEYRQ